MFLNHPVLVTQFGQAVVTSPTVRPNNAAGLHHFPDCWLKTFTGSISNSPQSNPANALAVFLRRDDHQCFSCCATASFSRLLAADENLIDLHDASESVPSGSYHGSPKLV
jgi:hypothetical protein